MTTACACRQIDFKPLTVLEDPPDRWKELVSGGSRLVRVHVVASAPKARLVDSSAALVELAFPFGIALRIPPGTDPATSTASSPRCSRAHHPAVGRRSSVHSARSLDLDHSPRRVQPLAH